MINYSSEENNEIFRESKDLEAYILTVTMRLTLYVREVLKEGEIILVYGQLGLDGSALGPPRLILRASRKLYVTAESGRKAAQWCNDIDDCR